MIMLNPNGELRWRRPLELERYGHVPAFISDGSFYLGSGANITLAAFDPKGNLRWQLGRPEFALSSPTVAPDGTIYLTAREPEQDARLLAVDPVGTLKWRFELGRGFALDPPVIHSNGTIYLVTSDRWIRAISPEGELLWNFQAPPRRRLHKSGSWEEFAKQWKEGFGLRKYESHGPPLLSPDGVLYVNFSHTGTIYAFEVGTP
jgi:outer membrane protein assembly factor BamB